MQISPFLAHLDEVQEELFALPQASVSAHIFKLKFFKSLYCPEHDDRCSSKVLFSNMVGGWVRQRCCVSCVVGASN